MEKHDVMIQHGDPKGSGTQTSSTEYETNMQHVCINYTWLYKIRKTRSPSDSNLISVLRMVKISGEDMYVPSS